MIDRLVVLNDVSVARGGATSIALDSIRALRAQNIPVTLIAGDDGNNSELRHLGVEIVALGQALLLDANKAEALFRGLYNPRTTAVVEDWIARNDTPRTIYHVHTWTKILSPSLFRSLRSVNERLIVSAHDFFLVCPNGGYVFYNSGKVCLLQPMSIACVTSNCDRRSYPQKLWRVARQAVRCALLQLDRRPPLVLAVHDNMREGLERGGIPKTSIRVLRNPVRAFSTSRVAAERNDEVFFIGRLNAEKGADLVAAAAMRAGVNLRIIGDGPMLAALKERYPKVRFEGRGSFEDISRMIASARVLVVPSRYPEPFGLVVAEAMWSGIPVILSETAMIADEVVMREAGIACDISAGGVLESAIRRVFDDNAATERMSKNAFAARDLANTYAEWSEQLIAIYEDRLNHTGA